MIQRRLAALMLFPAAFSRPGQTVEMPVLLPEKRLKVGLEVRYRGGGETTRENGTMKGFGLGPTLAGHPLTKVRFDLSPLFGVERSRSHLRSLRRLFGVVRPIRSL